MTPIIYLDLILYFSKTTNEKEESHQSYKFKATDLVRKTIRERNKRLGRKRTDSFNFPSFGDSSPDEESIKPVNIKNSTSSELNDFSGYKMKVIDQSEPKAEEPSTQEQPKVEDSKSCDNNSIISKRRRINSEVTSNLPIVFSPQSTLRPLRKRMVNNVEEEKDQMMKGGGYKMCIKVEELPKEENKESSGDQDYYN